MHKDETWQMRAMNYDGSKRFYYTVFLLRRQNQRKLTVITV